MSLPQRTRARSLPIVVVALLVACGLLTACATATYFGYNALRWADSGTPAATDTAASPESTAEAGAGGGTLRLAGGLPPTLDPGLAQDSTSAEYIVHLFSGLVRLNADLEVEADLAERWDVSEDGRTYTFTLRPGLTFADGRALEAEDVVYSLERACSPDLASPVAVSYLGDIVGVAEYASGAAEHIAGLSAPSESSVEITIDSPKAYFLAKLTYPAAFVVDREQIEREGAEWVLQPNGTGPFVLESLSSERIVLARNARYHGRLPSLDRVEYVIDGGFAITMYENDELDVASVPPSEVERMQDPANPLSAEVRVSGELSVTYLGVNVTEPPFDDPLVRQALATAIDRDKIADLVLQGTATAAYSVLPPGLPDHDSDLNPYPYDPEEARRLLAASRYGREGAIPEVVLATSGTSGYMDTVTEALVYMLQENLGMEVLVHQVEWGDFLGDMNARRYPLYLTGWIADYPDPENFLDLLFHGDSAQNHMGYRNDAVDELLERARVEQDEARRSALYREAEALIVADAPWIPLTHGLEWSLVKPYVRGFASTSAIYPWLQDVYIER